MSYPIAVIGADADEARKLRARRIRTSEGLLEAARTAKGRRQLAEDTGIVEKRLLCLANCADRMRIKGLGKEYATILPAVGVDTVKELKYRNPEKLAHSHCRAEQEAKDAPLPAHRGSGDALDRSGQEAAAEDHLPLRMTPRGVPSPKVSGRRLTPLP